MAKKWLLVAALMWLAVPVCCEAVGQAGQGGAHGMGGLDTPVGEAAGVGLGNSVQGLNLTHQPPFIGSLLDTGLLTQDQVTNMRTEGFGWGGIRISGLLADRIAPLIQVEEDQDPFQIALDGILTNRADGMGFGAIAHSWDLTLGRVLADAK